VNYRKEIDGLRALAVLAVIFYHAEYAFFTGGYIGVDVFFVISGYLITSIILRDLSNKSFKLSDFYIRRVRRIMPALFFVVAVVTIFSFMWLLPNQLRGYGKSLASIPLFSSNFIFFLEGGYFNVSANLKPLFHTWSLGIEEQFYFLYPFFLIAIWKTKQKTLFYVLILVLSFVVSHWWAVAHPEAAYLLLPSRIWEFFVGGMASIFGGCFFIKKVSEFKSASQWISLLGLLLIVVPVFFFDEYTTFPGFNALFPVAGTALTILFSTDRTYVGKIIANEFFVKIGLISFSLYLWHQPIFVFFRVFYNEHPDSVDKLCLIFLTFVLAFGTWKYIEIPFRVSQTFSKNITMCLLAFFSFSFLLIGTYIYSTNGIGKYYSSEDLIDLYSTKTITDTRCHANDRKTVKEIEKGDACKFGNKALQPSFALLGDSHASTLFKYLDEVYTSRGSFIGISNGNCPPLINGFHLRLLSVDNCREVNKASYDFLSKQDSIKKIVLFAEWSNYTEGYRVDSKLDEVKYSLAESSGDVALKVSDNAIVFKKSLLKTIDYLTEIGKEVIIIKPSPEFKEKVMDSIGRQIKQKVDFHRRTSPFILVTDYDERNHKVEKIFSEVTGVTFIDLKSILCNERICPSVAENGSVLYSDTNHLTYNGSKAIVDSLMKLLSSQDEGHTE
jgi:peptidoglycan/LPS O-acetylase OafA/YrhL